MRDDTLTHLSDAVLLRKLSFLVKYDRATTARMLAYLAEVDDRRLYAPAGFPSLFAYCVEELGMSEDMASKRIQAARVARRFPVLFTAVADGRLHLSAVCLLAPHLTPENVDEWIATATHRRKAEIEMHLARRFPSSAVPAMVRPIVGVPSQHAPGHVGMATSSLFDGHSGCTGTEPSSSLDCRVTGCSTMEHAPGHVDSLSPPSPTEQYLVQVTIPKDTHEKIRYAQSLLSHAIPTGDLVQLIDRAFDALIAQTEKRKVGAGTRQRATRADGSRRLARGGTASVHGLRLRCRAHNQYEAERVFGAGFMERKRTEARVAAHEARAATAAAEAHAAAEAQAAADEQDQDLYAGLRSLGCRADEARRAVLFSRSHHNATLEERMRAALAFISRRTAHRVEQVHQHAPGHVENEALNAGGPFM